MGLDLSPGESQNPANDMHLRGAEISSESDHVRTRLPTSRRGDPTNDVRQILPQNQLNHGEADKSRSRLRSPQSLLFGKTGRAMIQPIPHRQYSRCPDRSPPPTPELSDALMWRLAALVGSPPRPVPYKMAKPVLIYTDACGAGNVAATVFADGVRRVYRSHLRDRFMAEDVIFGYELAALLLGLRMDLCMAPGRPCFI